MPAPEPEYLSNGKDADQKPSAAADGAPWPEDTLWRRVPLFDPSGAALASFHTALARSARGEGKARVLFYGASHVAGEAFVHRVRERFQSRFGSGGPGFLMPVHPWRYYRPRTVDIESNARRWKTGFIKAQNPELDHYGLAGMFVETKRADAFGALVLKPTAAGKPGRDERAYELDVHFLAQPGGGDFTVSIDGEVHAFRTRGKERMPAVKTLAVPSSASRIEFRVKGNGPVRLFGTTLEREGAGVVVDTLGISGARARNQLYWDDASFRAGLAAEDPALVVLAYGTNESGDDDIPMATYEGEVRRVLARLRETVPSASCVLVGPSDRPLKADDGTYVPRPRTAEIVESQRRMATEFGCGFFDLVAFMGGPMSMPAWVTAEPPLAAADHVHLTARGYEALGDVFVEALLAGVPQADVTASSN
jgi:lysophospholipase L1-like esterase